MDEKRRILVVDDDDTARAMLAECLERDGYRVVEAAGGMDALVAVRTAFVKGRPFDALMLDLNMPQMSGIEFLQTLRGREWGSEVPVLVLSGRSDVESVLACKECGISGYLVKPYEPYDVRNRVAAALKEAAKRREAASRRSLASLEEEEAAEAEEEGADG